MSQYEYLCMTYIRPFKYPPIKNPKLLLLKGDNVTMNKKRTDTKSKMVSVRLTQNQYDRLKSKDKSVSKAIRRLVEGKV